MFTVIDEQEADPSSQVTMKEIAVISQHIVNWEELALNLNLSHDEIHDLLQQKARNKSEQCANMFNYWLAECKHSKQLSPRNLLARKLHKQGYQVLADILQTGYVAISYSVDFLIWKVDTKCTSYHEKRLCSYLIYYVTCHLHKDQNHFPEQPLLSFSPCDYACMNCSMCKIETPGPKIMR